MYHSALCLQSHAVQAEEYTAQSRSSSHIMMSKPTFFGPSVLETLVYSPFNHLMRLVAREYFTEFSQRESFQLYGTIHIVP
jgi:hypothetical protein